MEKAPTRALSWLKAPTSHTRDYKPSDGPSLEALIFGMNLTHGLEEHPSAFLVTLGGISVVMTGIVVGFSRNYNKLKVDTTSAQSFLALKNFFIYVDDLEFIVKKQQLDRREFKSALNKLTGLRVTDEESDFIFTMFDSNKDGYLHAEEELNLRKP